VSDDFLSKLREEPRPEYARELAERLDAIDEARAEAAAPRGWARRLPAFAGAMLVTLLALSFALEPVRAAARTFLDLFRVQRFAAVPVDPERLARLQQNGLDVKSLLQSQIEVTVQPQQPMAMSSAEAGAYEAGIALQQPVTLPNGYVLDDVSVGHPGAFRVRIDSEKLTNLAQLAGAEEIEIPAAWNGARIEVAMPPVLTMRYTRPDEANAGARDQTGYVFFQSKSPEVELPEGVDLATLGRLALRVSGMSASDAESFARSIDWRATLLVPVPMRGGSFREVEVNGSQALLVTGQAEPRAAGSTAPRRRPRSVLVWAAGDKVFGIHGPGSGIDIVAMAQSIR
jgi:hypothetical protein